jgi:hypothetical protein
VFCNHPEMMAQTIYSAVAMRIAAISLKKGAGGILGWSMAPRRFIPEWPARGSRKNIFPSCQFLTADRVYRSEGGLVHNTRFRRYRTGEATSLTGEEWPSIRQTTCTQRLRMVHRSS